MIAVCDMIKFGFKKVDFDSSVRNISEENKAGDWIVS